jgi:hypothetical protein
MKNLPCTALILIASLILAASPLPAQSIWTMRGERSALEVEYLHPVLKDGANPSSADIITISTRVRSGNTTAVTFELPWVSGTTSSSFLFESQSQSAIGNPYLGIEFESDDKQFFGEIGVRLPLMSEQSTTAAIAGITGDFDRFEAYTPNIFQVGGALNLKPELGGGFSIRLRCGPYFDFSTRESGGSETLINYAAVLAFESESVGAGAGIAGRSNTAGNASNSTVGQFEGSLRLHVDKVHPALQLRIPLDEALQNLYDIELGINLAIQF